ncbi:MAG: immunoglobulin domain-containing protein [Holophagaceae bacterium]|uniref:Immunoglobulin domain-containing protein n=1 Tax=Candidatus Geothrix skivensis TaxID=2954439 RepID=A0A9D7XI94_9BACT|nr:immunoglobulin domain-containing protein [Candidatus Geothrix skivensis]
MEVFVNYEFKSIFILTTFCYKIETSGLCKIMSFILLLCLYWACGGGHGDMPPVADQKPPTITAHPASLTVMVGDPATFTVTATGTGPISYQWLRDGNGINGAPATPSYTLAVTTEADNGAKIWASVSNFYGHVESDPATLTVTTDPPKITTQPVAQSVSAGHTATFTVVATGDGPLGYQWQRSNNSGATWSQVSAGIGGTTATYETAPTVLTETGAHFRVLVSGRHGTVTSNSAKLTVLP